MAKIYTKTGDKGKTSLIGGTRVNKNDLRVECYGTVDELNAHIGLLNDELKTISLENILPEIQNNLFIIGSLLAADANKSSKFSLPELREEDVVLLEKEIDKMNESLPKMTHFILPGGHIFVSQAHIARTVCRRSERWCVELLSELNDANILLIVKYLNRLSDYLFVLARFIAKRLNVEEVKWIPRHE
ncbi:ATP:cob(I)alamin adenosyltransferase [Arachidicoccus ginsenosidimutans]|uniref:cob(I)yrinic acid a,c-diamide adenosyltransferase n=1 Tax=Arachidicoccus sp. BS20 TaxID=1850526 RepID=UPI0007F0B88C|nr:cob(I)yrinic acid a,c-diamide adenosyltransferase [Arachidicoccus sp. BS20]ANI90695.1 ATP:cob(I)alamin adenosyltransferase [Arachidicoccus sp. BS20]